MSDYIDMLQSLSHKQLMVMLARQRQEETQGIAMVGVGCRFPGGLDDPAAYWRALRDGRAVPQESDALPADSLGRPRWNVAAEDLAPLAGLLSSGAYLDAVDLFDADYFGMSEQEATYLDPQQRLLLEVTVQALADANLTRAQLTDGRKVGVYVGVSTVEYNFAALRNGLRPQDLSPYMGTGTALSATAGRIALALGSSGPTMTIDTACSSAITALHLAAAALRRRECDVAVIGACHLLLSPFTSDVFAKAGMLSAAGRSRPFADDADGHVRAEGCGILVLERKRDADEAGRPYYAVLRGSAVHQHGDRPEMSAASAAGQRTVIELALSAAGVEPADVRYVEAQANGSRIGGVIEAETLGEVYRAATDAPPLYVGSHKANLGYLETASGAAGLIKTVLALANAEIPPHVGADRPDPGIAWDRLGLKLPDKPLPWPGDGRRIAAVSAFGFTGTNAHALLEAAPGPAAVPPTSVAALLAVSAHSDAALAATAARLRDDLSARTDWDHASVCRTLIDGRDHRPHRHAAVVRDRAGLLAWLDFWAGDAPEPPVAQDGDLRLEAELYLGGGQPGPAALWPDGTRPPLIRLPGPVLLGRRYWSDGNTWS
ncbi:MAG TPA: polyketide synthase [Actinocrinis sp.]|uniref:beta-ketoacyl [acyl carrier protein] synthase domain-containing protein n=1 Tax=Actinocrinis sp. TaxID=1920516 RepID=UPI002DDD9346|nr:polyketide synthase [Actinocrinis sp.]HEV2344622.1 polyketide synthase [Actinocrinis sp.]